MPSAADVQPGARWRIRPALLADVGAMQQVEVDAGERFRQAGLPSIADDGPYDEAVLEEHLADGRAWVAEDGAGTVVGYVMTSVVDGEGHLDQVSVAIAAQGRGLGSALVEAACEWAALGGHRAITLTTFRDLSFNGPFYRRRGFVALAQDAMGPELAAIRAREAAGGIDVAPRLAMRRDLTGAPDPTASPARVGPAR